MIPIIIKDQDAAFLHYHAAVINQEENNRDLFLLPVFYRNKEDAPEIYHIQRDPVVNSNDYIKHSVPEKGKISDGYHTFDELYEHRIVLWIAFLKERSKKTPASPDEVIWATKKHSDGTEWPGWFLLGLGLDKGKQITYHLPEKCWDEVNLFVHDKRTIAPDFDGHTPADVLERLKNI